MMPGQGHILLDVVTILFVFFAGVCQLAIYMDRTLMETPNVETARMIMFVGYMIIGTRWSFLFFQNDMDLAISPILLIGVLLTAVSQVMIAADRLLHGKRRYDDVASSEK